MINRILGGLAAAVLAVGLTVPAAADVSPEVWDVPDNGVTSVYEAMAQIDRAAPELIAPELRALVPAKGRAIVVNIPSFELIAFEDQVPVLRSRVVVGKPRTPTPVMVTETSVVRFRPTWTPTKSMIRRGIKPGTRRPGKGNPLGYLAIRLEPGMLIYLHGTNKPHLYDNDMRALSYGCVRVERWEDVAAWVLEASVEEVQGHAFGRRTFDMETGGIPVFMTYLTEFPDAQGVMRSWPDIYNRGAYAGIPVAN
ncbi:MAG: L,D-transpeptidase family protein [Pseudomonadota bacterium]